MAPQGIPCDRSDRCPARQACYLFNATVNATDNASFAGRCDCWVSEKAGKGAKRLRSVLWKRAECVMSGEGGVEAADALQGRA